MCTCDVRSTGSLTDNIKLFHMYMLKEEFILKSWNYGVENTLIRAYSFLSFSLILFQ